jgi:hypothetical protein
VNALGAGTNWIEPNYAASAVVVRDEIANGHASPSLQSVVWHET